MQLNLPCVYLATIQMIMTKRLSVSVHCLAWKVINKIIKNKYESTLEMVSLWLTMWSKKYKFNHSISKYNKKERSL